MTRSPETAASMLAHSLVNRPKHIASLARCAVRSLNNLSHDTLIRLARNDTLPGRLRNRALKTLIARFEIFPLPMRHEKLADFFPLNDLHMLGGKQMVRVLASTIAEACNGSAQPEEAWQKVFYNPGNVYVEEPVWLALVQQLKCAPANKPILCQILEKQPAMLADFSPAQYRRLLDRWCGELACAEVTVIARQVRLLKTVFSSIPEYPCISWVADTLRFVPVDQFDSATWEEIALAAVACGFGEVLGRHERFTAWFLETEKVSPEAAFIAARWSTDERVMRRGYDMVVATCTKNKQWPTYTAQLVVSAYWKARKETMRRLESMRPGERAHYLGEALLSIKSSAISMDREGVDVERLIVMLAGEDGEFAAFTLTTLITLSRLSARSLPNARGIEKMAVLCLKNSRYPWKELRRCL